MPELQERCERHPDREGVYAFSSAFVFNLDWRSIMRPDQTYGPFCMECRSEFIAWACTIPGPALIHYTDHHGHSVCPANVVLTSLNGTEVRSKVTCPECAALKPVYKSTWPEDCPTCHAPWKARSKTMNAKMGQPHRGTCQNGHRWYERYGRVKSYSATMDEPPVPLETWQASP